MTRQTGFSTKRNRSGFTLAELLVAVAILVVLLVVAMLSLSTIRKQLRQKELDSKAETIYMAVQLRMAEMRAAGYENLYQADADGVTQLGYRPYDADESISEDMLYYVVSPDDGENMSEAAAQLMTKSTVDEELRENQWIIEYNPSSGSVYGVFYSETNAIPNEGNGCDSLRVKKMRLRDGAKVGYYGGDTAEIDTTDTLSPEIKIDNKEELKATFTCINPTPGATLTFKITLTDTEGNKYERTVNQNELTQVTGKKYTFIWTLDSLKSDTTRFYAQTEGKLKCGTELKVSLTVTSSDTLVEPATVEDKTNSLFDDDSTKDTAKIHYARHLQNLDEGSHVIANIKNAVQISDISFADDVNDVEDWYSLYGEYFTPIKNSNLTSYNGCSTVNGTDYYTSINSLHIRNTSGDAGLFKIFSGTVANVVLTGTKISGGIHVGALIGSTSGNVTVENCSVMLSARKGDLDDITTVSSVADVKPWINGTTVGGLIGSVGSYNQVKISNSFAATVLNGKSVAGGLVGVVKASGTVSADTVYADCYLVAPTTGGLFGSTNSSSSVMLKDFYAVGYQLATNSAAGIASGYITSATNGYSACDLQGTTATKYSTAASATVMSNVYYLTGDNKLTGTEYKSYEQLSSLKASELGSSFTNSSGSASYPYNLMGQGLSTYSYPRISKLDHYGDWRAEFESGLVYYEVYSDGSYGFEGANVSALSNSKTVVGDGYALAYKKGETPDSNQQVTVKYNNGQSASFTFGSSLNEVKVSDETQYFLRPLPTEVVNPDLAVDTFYQQITINDGNGDKSYYYNPYFAKTVTTDDKTPTAPSTIHIRTARQLYALSLYYDKYAAETSKSVFSQELDIDYSSYDWTTYYSQDKGIISTQAPIGISGDGFIATYNGGYHTVTGIGVESLNAATGFFGTIGSSGSIRNLFLVGRLNTDNIVRKTDNGVAADGSRNSTQMGALAGVNKGTITNCAVSGYTMRYYGYNSNVITVGGLVGTNSGIIRGCSADAASIELTANSSFAYAGGFAGCNSGSITSCYATGCLNVLESRNSTVWLAGFVGDNTKGSATRCYSATALTAAGDAETYGFARVGGAVSDCYYLDGGTYSYAGNLYAYNTSTNEYSAQGLAAGKKLTGSDLQNLSLSDYSKASASYNHAKTGTDADNYLYPAVVRKSGQTVHFGNWPVLQHIGSVGVFYWEYESGGSNSGYHFSYIGTSDEGKISGNTLCQSHDDGGVITEYGYGYFYADAEPTFNEGNSNLGDRNTAAETNLAAQMPGYNFIAYTTGEGNNYLHTTTFTQNDTWQLTTLTSAGTNVTYTFSVCPFFADAMSLGTMQPYGENAQSMNGITPGYEGNKYLVRSEAQLQFINWNSNQQKVSCSITSSNYSNQTLRNSYPYLLSGSPTSVPDKNYTKFYWEQSHDIDAYEENGQSDENFTPIGSLYDTGFNDANAQPYVAFFAYNYDGQSYAIKNISITSTNQCIGLFGVTAGAQLRNIVMYSDRGNEIVNEADGTCWYSIGGIAGFAGSRKDNVDDETDCVFTNCTVSGYKIIDKRANTPGWGGANIGGLVGLTNMDIENCSAVNDIILQSTYKDSYKNIRVGGIAGVARCTINSCYAGGSIKSEISVTDPGTPLTTNVWVGGIAGGIVVRNSGKLEDLLGFTDCTLVVANCYSYVDLPAAPKDKNDTSGNYNHVRASMSIASNGEMLKTGTITIGRTSTVWFARWDVPVRVVRIYNCYALESAVKNTSDYQNFGNYSSLNGTNINTFVNDNDSGGNDSCGVYVYNGDSSMYLTYDEMMSSMLSKLNVTSSVTYDYTEDYKYNASASKDTYTKQTKSGISTVGKFATVTTEEQGVVINGKYSFPGNDPELNGLNYPFPTVLTQTDIFSNTVNVHYGAWPKSGIYWEESSVDFDIYSSRKQADDGTTMPLLDVKLYLYGMGNDVSLDKDDIAFVDDADNTLTDSPIEVYKISEYDADKGCFTITFKGLKEGTAYVKATIGDKTAQTIVNVKNSFTIKSDVTGTLELEPGESKTVNMKLYVDEAQLMPDNNKLKFDVDIKTGTGYVICGSEDVTYAKSTGIISLPIKGELLDSLTDKDALIAVTCTYTYGDNDESMQATVNIPTVTKAPDFAAIKLNGESDGDLFQKNNDDSITSKAANALINELPDSGDGIYLRNGYAVLSEITLSSFELEIGEETYKANDKGEFVKTADDNAGETIAKITLSEKSDDTDNNLSFYSVVVEGYKQTSDAKLIVTVREGTTLSVKIEGVPQEETETDPQEGESAGN